MRQIIYFDTSALAKWYIRERESDSVEKYIKEAGVVDISDLTIVEMRVLLARRRREKDIDPRTETKIYSAFEEDIRQKYLICHPLSAVSITGAVDLLSILTDLPLKTLDLLHLAIAREIQAKILVTSDRVMAAGAKVMGFSVVRFSRQGEGASGRI